MVSRLFRAPPTDDNPSSPPYGAGMPLARRPPSAGPPDPLSPPPGTPSFAPPAGPSVNWGLLPALGLSAPPAADAAGLDFGFNYDFPVNFEGFIVDHRVLVDVLVTGQLIGFVGALIGGREARLRKEEISKLARKLQLVNRQLRNMNRQMRRNRMAHLTQAATEGKPLDAVTQHLLDGQRCLRDREGARALDAFQRALVMVRAGVGDLDPALRADAEVEAYRGIGMAYQLMAQPQEALRVMQEVQALCSRMGDKAGVGDAFGIMGDLYVEMNQIDKAADAYDRYLVILASEDWLWRLTEDTSWM
jgi:hypothetical protein